ncbi:MULTISPECIES: hypothetical protein [Eikenella]|uniref:hypothetical protein n=1 Tax=Eikenella TaxID=538 RepID=UPI000B2B05EA|nr:MULTISPECIES: hypothetical protein [Eikenella]
MARWRRPPFPVREERAGGDRQAAGRHFAALTFSGSPCGIRRQRLPEKAELVVTPRKFTFQVAPPKHGRKGIEAT